MQQNRKHHSLLEKKNLVNDYPHHRMHFRFEEKGRHVLRVEQSIRRLGYHNKCFEKNQDQVCIEESNEYTIECVGTLRDAKVIDTTGAGDAFIAGYLLCWHCFLRILVPKGGGLCDDADLYVTLCLNFATWVAGKKLGGHGARGALPTSKDVDEVLGTDQWQMLDSLKAIITAQDKHFRFLNTLVCQESCALRTSQHG